MNGLSLVVVLFFAIGSEQAKRLKQAPATVVKRLGRMGQGLHSPSLSQV